MFEPEPHQRRIAALQQGLKSLQLIAGPRAAALIEAEGLTPETVSCWVGASGGPKWMALYGLDDYLAAAFFPRRSRPLTLLGSSSGAWRAVCHAAPQPQQRLQAFCEAYRDLRFPPGSSQAEVTRISSSLLDAIVPDAEVAEAVCAGRRLKPCIVTARSRWLRAEGRAGQAATVLLAASMNLAGRRALGLCFERVLLHAGQTPPDCASADDVPTRTLALTPERLRPALMATAAIPLVLEPVAAIPGAPAGPYLDGGVTDYHFDLPFAREGLVLYPHFYPYAVPGWFDKALRWRHRGADAPNFANVLLLCPSAQWVATLPGARIPDRRDFTTLDDAERIRRWDEAIRRSAELAEDFARLLERLR